MRKIQNEWIRRSKYEEADTDDEEHQLQEII